MEKSLKLLEKIRRFLSIKGIIYVGGAYVYLKYFQKDER